MTATVDLSAYKNLYLQTAREQVAALRNGLLMVRLNPADEVSITKLRISAHSLKGQSLAMGYEKTALYCRLIEYIFRDALDNKIKLTPELVNSLKDAAGQVEASLAEIEKSGKETDLSVQEKTLEKLSGVTLPPPV